MVLEGKEVTQRRHAVERRQPPKAGLALLDHDEGRFY
jgi:hypothetical protein